ncbi:MAG: hypothetical protein II998_00295 [Clostridia bacterium]|nr:hypothetical protein [Clostridia bacterium]
MSENKLQNQINEQPDKYGDCVNDEKTFVIFGKEITISAGAYKVVRMVLPITVIAICAIFVFILMSNTMSVANNIEGKFEIVDVDSNNYINLESDGVFSMSGDIKGKWTLDGNVLTFKASSGESFEGRFIDRKYIVLVDSNYYFGQIPSGDMVEAQLASQGGSIISLDADGNAYEGNDESNDTVGSYRIDGSFVIVTVNNVSTTYLKCGDGISPVFYQIS